MASIGLFSVESMKLVLFSIVSYFLYVYLLKPTLNFVRMVIHYHGFHCYPKHWLFGHGKEVWPNFPFPIETKRLAMNLYEFFPKIIGPNQNLTVLWISMFPVVFASGHEAVEIVLNKKQLKKPHIYKFMGLRSGLLTSEPAIWKVRRKLIEPFFSTKKMKGYAKAIYEEVESFSQHLEGEVGKPVDLVNQIHTSTLNIILKSTASIPLDDLIEDKKILIELVSAVEKNSVKRVSNPFYQFDWLFKFFKFSKIYYKTMEDAEEMIHKILNRRKQLLESSPPNGPEDQDFVHLLEDKVDREGLHDEMMTLIAAGHETTAVALRWLLFNLGNHLGVQEKLYQEIIEFFPDDTPVDDMDKINQCNYLDQCLKESLRLNPPVNGAGRVLEEDIMVKDKRLLKGSIVGVTCLACHHDPSVYPNPDEYDPDRWNSENVSKIPKASFIPFGYGPRICIGLRYAMIELKIYTIQIIRKFSIRSTRKHGNIPILYEITFQPALPLEIIMTPRNENQQKLFH
ncbi:cytochrome P450 4C1-like [Tetranychus urticae]|uniref:Cytochrome P450 n=1 Tax=Tetranychus urticae TaxID=32264 RepID=T1K628_TETUR|nr:cytochrome P450 4C1-like [Tetranychus urticae]